MFKIKLYLYDSTQESNGYRGADLSKYDNKFNNLFEQERKYNKIKSI